MAGEIIEDIQLNRVYLSAVVLELIRITYILND